MPNLYDSLCLMKNLRKAYRKARKGKRTKWYVREFEGGFEKNLLRLQKELINQTYQPMRMKTFVIRDPKTRVISASAFRDRIVHHALCNIIEPIFEKSFIYDSYANRKGKGTHAAIERFDYFKRKVSGNGKRLGKDNNMVYGYALKADIKHYFDSVDHEILMKIIGRRIKDEKILWLISKIIQNNNCKISGKGMPIGNLTSQFFANVYLNELDNFVKHSLKAKYYIRYVDDFVILDASRERLEFCKEKINEFLKTIRLELHPEKSKIYPLHKGISFLGFRVFYNYKLPYKRNRRGFMKRLDELLESCRNGRISTEEIRQKVQGWLAYAECGNTYKLRDEIGERLGKELC